MNYYLYQITNKKNGMIYIGVHCTNKIQDTYMGSGIAIKEAIKLEGKENFTKEIKEYFENKVDMLAREAEIVNEDFIKRTDTYNIALGGGNVNGLLNKNRITVKDKYGKTFKVNMDDPGYLNGEFVAHRKNTIKVRDKNGNYMFMDKNDVRLSTNEFTKIIKGRVVLKDKNGNRIRYKKDHIINQDSPTGYIKNKRYRIRAIDSSGKIYRINLNDTRYLRGELIKCPEKQIVAIDKNGNKFRIDVNDPRYLNGELKKIVYK